MTKYAEREVHRHVLPIPENVILANTQAVVLDFATGDSVDYGALCYLERSHGRAPYKGRRVALDSFSKTREAEVARLITLTRMQYTDAALRPKTLYAYHRETAKFIDWCDANGHHEVLSSPQQAQAAIKFWGIDARRRISGGQVSHNTAEQIQRAFPILKDYFADYDLTAGINLLRCRPDLAVPTPVPTEDAVGTNVAFATCIFDGIYDLVVNNRPFPYPLKMPYFLGWPNDTLWLFPTHRWAISPEEELARKATECSRHVNKVIDYQTGRIRSVEEVPPSSCETSEEMVQKILTKLSAANSDPHHFYRVLRGVWGIQAFFIIFLAATGMNFSQAIALSWSEELDTLTQDGPQTRQNFRAIKYRACGKEVVFQISARYLPHLKRFLALRKHLLNDIGFEKLFFGLHDKRQCARHNETRFCAASEAYEQNFLTIARRLTSKLPRVCPRMFRSAKDNHLIRTETPSTTALVMQRSLKSTIQKYASGTSEDVANEMGEYLNEVERKILDAGSMPLGSEPRSLGVCTDLNKPEPIAGNIPANPDCTRNEGCLFCEKYRAHADDVDARKLLSCHFVLRQTASFASSAEEHDAVFGQILRRIDFVLGAIVRHKPGMAGTVASVRTEVDKEGLLHPYWAAKMEFLMELREL